MPARGDAGDSTRKRSPGVDSALGADCDGYAKDIVKYFYGEIPKGRFTSDAVSHLERSAAWAICYSHETSNKKSKKFWKGSEGEKYWQNHARQIARILLCHNPQGPITGQMVQTAIDEHAPKFLSRLRRLLKTLELRAFEAAVLPESDPPRDPTLARSRLDRDTIVKMLGGCPYDN
jgi:hypothetical protein